MPKFRVVACAILLSLFLAAYQILVPPALTISGAQAQSAAKKEQKVTATIALPGVQVETLNPYGHSTTQIYPTWKHVIEPLIEWSWSKRQIVPILAESWSNPDHNTWVFKLKKGVKFHDGSDFTSADVVHSFSRIQKDPDSKQGSSIAHVTEIEAVDPLTVRLRTKSPDAALLFRLMQRFITNKAAYDRLGAAAADKLALGTGPYKLKDWVRGQWFVVEKNPGYAHSDHKPTVDEIVFRNIGESEVAITSLLNKEVDVISNIPPESAARVTGGARIETARTINIMFLGMHSSVPQFGTSSCGRRSTMPSIATLSSKTYSGATPIPWTRRSARTSMATAASFVPNTIMIRRRRKSCSLKPAIRTVLRWISWFRLGNTTRSRMWPRRSAACSMKLASAPSCTRRTKIADLPRSKMAKSACIFSAAAQSSTPVSTCTSTSARESPSGWNSPIRRWTPRLLRNRRVSILPSE